MLIAKRKAGDFGFPKVGGLFLLYTEPVTDGKVPSKMTQSTGPMKLT